MNSIELTGQIHEACTKLQLINSMIALLGHAIQKASPSLNAPDECPLIGGLHQIELMVIEARHLYSNTVAAQIRVHGTSQPVSAHDRVLDAAGGLAYANSLFRDKSRVAVESNDSAALQAAWKQVSATAARIARNIESVSSSELSTERDRAIAAIMLEARSDSFASPPALCEQHENQVSYVAARSIIQSTQRNAENPESVATSKVSKEAVAMGVLINHPDWSVDQIANAVGCHRTTLYGSEQFMAAFKVNKSSQQSPRRVIKGTKDKKTRELEAWDESSTVE